MKIRLKDAFEFKCLLLRKGYSVRAMGRGVGISSGYAVQLANGNRNPSPDVARKITEFLNVDFDDIFYVESACSSNHAMAASK